jgi:uncharacterized membrane protein YdbT with pleckstrin-like domain
MTLFNDDKGGIDEHIRSSLQSESSVLWESSEGQITNLKIFLLALIFCFLVIPVLYALFRATQTAFHTYKLTNQRLTEANGIFSRHTEELELYRIKDITVEEPFVHRIFGKGHVVLHTSDRSTPVVMLKAIAEPKTVARLVRDCVEKSRNFHRVREID